MIYKDNMSYYSKLNYFLISLKKFLTKRGLRCPSCNSKDNETVDKKYIIKGLAGQIGYENDIQNCYKKKNTMVYDINKVITKSTRTETTDKVKHTYDKTGNSYVSSHFYFLKNGNIAIQCYDWSKKLEEKFADKLIVSFKSQVFEDFIVNEAYN